MGYVQAGHLCGDKLIVQYKWWEDEANDGSEKWQTFHHNGILFPPPYVPLPKGIKMKYEGESDAKLATSTSSDDQEHL